LPLSAAPGLDLVNLWDVLIIVVCDSNSAHLLRQTIIALKVLHRKEPEALYRFKREFRSLADLHHPNLIRL
jgi:hypothetical protein